MKNLRNALNKSFVTKTDFNLKNTLSNGQAFNWEDKSQDKYIGVVGNMLLLMGYNDDLGIQYQLLNEIDQIEYTRHESKAKNIEQKLNDVLNIYLRLDYDLPSLMSEWRKDSYFNDVGTNIQGLRMLKQEPFECLVSFIVSQNNNIKRIASNLLSIRRAFGTLLGTYDKVDYYRFPSMLQLLQAQESQLREMGLGYRASYIIGFAKSLEALGGEQYLLDLIGKEDEFILQKLLQFKGVGRKVADCVRLFSMECNSVVPVDTHVFQIYMNKYSKGSKKKVDSGCYSEVQDLFKSKFGEHAGWAHSYLFAAQLPEFKPKSTTKKIKKVPAKVPAIVEQIQLESTEIKINKKVKQLK